ncbi:hypothetical protein MPH_01284 [Macrophomina phaseolina MS6]|uniref:BTB/POZ-like protein n=1 Tax=Macrophomina phaseolina (strain MS6) TaxID=1126212 RepID=K2S8T0_MACPH|nr:hypothetical protein MPH_01284 [Macrophomina phaseolina MS6]
MDWLYTGTWTEASDETLTHAYIFADIQDVPNLRDVIMAEFHRMYTSERYVSALPEYTVVRKAFENLPDSSRLCVFFLDLYGARWIYGYDSEEEARERESLSLAFLMPFIDKLGRRASSKRKRIPDVGRYLEQHTQDGDRVETDV